MKICPNCSESIDNLSKDGFCFNCQSDYEIGISKKSQSPYLYSMYVFASKCLILIIIGLSLLFVATRLELNKSETFLSLMCNFRGGNYFTTNGTYDSYCEINLSNINLSTSIDTGGISGNNKLKIEVFDGKESIFD